MPCARNHIGTVSALLFMNVMRSTAITFALLALFTAIWPLSDSRVRSTSAVRGWITRFFEWFGELGFFCGRLAKAAVRPPFEFRELIRQCDSAGAKSALLVA